MNITIPEPLEKSLQTFLNARPHYTTDRAFTEAIALFLLQHRTDGVSSRQCSRIYLDSLFKKTAEVKL
jgi:hypothetical protein